MRGVIEAVKGEILDDMDNGILPNDVNSFEALHGHVDANEYGDLLGKGFTIAQIDGIQQTISKWLAKRLPRPDQKARDSMALTMNDHRRELMKYSWDFTAFTRGLIAGVALSTGCSMETLTQLRRMRDVNVGKRASLGNVIRRSCDA